MVFSFSKYLKIEIQLAASFSFFILILKTKNEIQGLNNPKDQNVVFSKKIFIVLKDITKHWSGNDNN